MLMSILIIYIFTKAVCNKESNRLNSFQRTIDETILGSPKDQWNWFYLLLFLVSSFIGSPILIPGCDFQFYVALMKRQACTGKDQTRTNGDSGSTSTSTRVVTVTAWTSSTFFQHNAIHDSNASATSNKQQGMRLRLVVKCNVTTMSGRKDSNDVQQGIINSWPL
jgi:hypothetical protein